ncbi:MAG: mechanosensitive ion channel domain-containing protein [Halieaceae bacterium]
MEQLKPILMKLAQYGELIMTGMAVMFGGMLAIFVLYRMAASLIKPGGTYARVMKVAFGALYAMILVLTIVLAAERLGYNVSGLAGIAILLVLVGATLFFFLIPFLPRLPFVTGNMIEVRGVMGTVEAITAYQTVIRKFDGQTVFLPSAMVMASPITNYTLIPERRIELNVSVYASDDLARAKAALLELMSAQEQVLSDPEPSVFITGIDDGVASLVAYCWVENANWFGTRDALWAAIATTFSNEAGVSLALPQIALHNEPHA